MKPRKSFFGNLNMDLDGEHRFCWFDFVLIQWLGFFSMLGPHIVLLFCLVHKPYVSTVGRIPHWIVADWSSNRWNLATFSLSSNISGYAWLANKGNQSGTAVST